MVTLESFTVSTISNYVGFKSAAGSSTIDILAGDPTAQQVILQATEVRQLCENPIVMNGIPIVPKTVEVILGCIDKQYYIHGVRMTYKESTTGKIDSKYHDYSDFVRIAEARKK